MLADLGWTLAGIGREGDATLVFQQAEESLKGEVEGIKDSNLAPYLLEALGSSGFLLHAETLSRQIRGALDNMSITDNEGYLMQECALACGGAGQFGLARKFIDKVGGSTRMKMAFTEMSREAIKQNCLTEAVELALAWPHFMEPEHWAEMLP